MSKTKDEIRDELVTMALTRIGLSGCGWLFPYHIGVLSYLKTTNLITKSTILSGLSGGSLVAVGEASGLSENEMMEVATNIVQRWSLNGTKSITIFDVWGTMNTVVAEAMDEALPHDAHLRCNDTIRIAVTPVDKDRSGFIPLLSILPISPIWNRPIEFGGRDNPFQSKQDLLACCLCSSHIPYYMDGNFSRKWRGSNWVDGGLLDILPPTPEEDVNSCIQSLPYNIMSITRKDKETLITPTRQEISLFRELLPWTFAPSGNKDNLYRLRDLGYVNAERFVELKRSQGI